MNIREIKVSTYMAPCGNLLLGSFGDKLCLCDWIQEGHNHINQRLMRRLCAIYKDCESPVTERAKVELDEYFSGQRRNFDIPLLPVGTDFQLQVWRNLLKIPYGTTISYKELATKIDNPKAVRAVANANHENSISIFIPCHRVIGNDGSLTGYGGGLDVKEYLLKLEGAI